VGAEAIKRASTEERRIHSIPETHYENSLRANSSSHYTLYVSFGLLIGLLTFNIVFGEVDLTDLKIASHGLPM
jgi:hypothetical protein